MSTLKKYSIDGKEIGTVSVDERLAKAEANGQMIKDYLVAIRANKRQWSAHTKGRSEVVGSTKKIRPQKGTGGARHGSAKAPQFRGGGVVFGPKPKFDQHVRINRKERLAAIRALLGEMIRNQRVYLIDSLAMDAPKTQKVGAFLKGLGITRNVLFLGEAKEESIETEGAESVVSIAQKDHKNFFLSARNIPIATCALAKNVSGYDLARAHDLVMTEEALQQITEWLCK